jgi:nitroimidazol reductase NimA-like FMN-containing flavoprotein (pyridoxamine 5'-phosphate oxidase superfamily)
VHQIPGEAHRLGRLACCIDNQPFVVPIYYVLKNTYLYSFSMPGKKVDIMRQNPRVSLLVEEIAEGGTWKSVIAAGHFEEPYRPCRPCRQACHRQQLPSSELRRSWLRW